MNRVFREEKKYLISLPEALQACHRLAQVMHEDPHNGISGYPVRSLYFDTLDDRDFHEKAAGVELRRKSAQALSARDTGGCPSAHARRLRAAAAVSGVFCRGVLRADAQPVLSPQNDRRI